MKKEKRSNAVFYGLMGIMLGLFVISLIATGGKSIYQFLFYDRKDIFMDFFNSINDCFSGDTLWKEMYLSAADLCHLYDLQQISANGYGKKTRNVCRA